MSESEVEHGERYAQSPLTGTCYRVTKWIDQGKGKIRAVEKEEVDQEDVPVGWLPALDELRTDGGQPEAATDRDRGGFPDGDPCPECGQLMDVGAVGNPGETITWQQCDDCRIGWGPFTGYVDLDEDEVSPDGR